MKDTFCMAVGALGAAIASLYGGWDAALQTLILFMAVDYVTGLIVAGVFHASPKSRTGALESRAGWKGLIRKGETLLIVLVACRLDAVMATSFVRDAVVIGFICNETISIVENAGLMGLPSALGAFSAFAIFLIRQFFMSLPLELDDAAKIDGCGYFRSYLLIHFPLAKSVLSVNAILCFNGAWGDFFNPLIFLKSIQNMTLPLGLSMLQGMYSQQSPAVNVATMVVALIPVLIVFLIGRKRLIAGVATTGMKM